MNNQSFVNCELKNIKFGGLERFTINWNRTEVLKAIGQGISSEISVNGSIPSAIRANESIIDVSTVDVDSLVLQVKFKSSKIAAVPNEIFHKFPSLQIFDASDSEVKSLSTLTFNNAANLLMIFLYNNQLKSITSYVFVHTKNLEVLDLSSNQISRVDQMAFTSLGKLKRLSLSNNRIKTLDDFTFQPLKSLKWILLENNQLSLISSDMFTAENLDLYGILAKNNAIDSISYFVLDKLPSLRFLELSGNKCFGSAINNHVIKDNAFVKLELHTCHQNHRKMKLSSDKKQEMSTIVDSTVKSLEHCLIDMTKILTTISSIETQIEISRNYFFPKT